MILNEASSHSIAESDPTPITLRNFYHHLSVNRVLLVAIGNGIGSQCQWIIDFSSLSYRVNLMPDASLLRGFDGACSLLRHHMLPEVRGE